MKRQTDFKKVHFHADVIRNASQCLFASDIPEKDFHRLMTVTNGDSEWTFDTEEEFFSDYQAARDYAFFLKSYKEKSVQIHRSPRHTVVSITASDRSIVQAVYNVFEAAVPQSGLPDDPKPAEPRPKIFIGHGRNPLWRDLMDHLHHQHDYPIEAFETGARAGHAIRDVLENMLDDSSFAILVLTGEDQTADGSVRARQNVIHETGLFQGRLGFSRAIVLLEDGTEEFSNIYGIQQIRFSKGNIRETFGDVLATLRREFPDVT